jgi:hypothetical protein
MGRLVPVFEATDRGKLFEGKFRDDDTDDVGYLESVRVVQVLPGMKAAAVVQFVVDKTGQEV